ncbi:transcriptional regulator [Pseudonocardia acidicola]|nr:transcriptional regulator [Pseudonocardia acidicola]
MDTLRKDGYIEQRRTYLGRAPRTTVRATDEGRHRFLGMSRRCG